jgi:hypothetical protein
MPVSFARHILRSVSVADLSWTIHSCAQPNEEQAVARRIAAKSLSGMSRHTAGALVSCPLFRGETTLAYGSAMGMFRGAALSRGGGEVSERVAET